MDDRATDNRNQAKPAVHQEWHLILQGMCLLSFILGTWLLAADPLPSRIGDSQGRGTRKKVLDASQLKLFETAVANSKRPEDALDLLAALRETTTLKPDQLGRVIRLEATWKDRQKKGMLKLGGNWVSAAEFERKQKQSNELVNNAWDLILIGDYKSARGLLEQASKVDLSDYRADYLLGIFNSGVSPVVRDLPRARKHFQVALNRSPEHISLLNNLGILDVQCGDSKAGIEKWNKALTLSPETPEVIHNLAKLVADARAGLLPISGDVIKKAGLIYASSVSETGITANSGSSGWLYMPLYSERPFPSEEETRESKQSTILSGTGSGFAIGEGLVCTNFHVVEGADQILIADPTSPGKVIEAEVLAHSSKDDLAILRCPDLRCSALPFDEKKRPVRGTEVVAMGYPLATKLGTTVKATRGIIAGDVESTDRLILDAMLNPGNSGGPLCDRNGAVVGVNVAVLDPTFEDVANSLGFAIPMDKVAILARTFDSGFTPASPRTEELDWSAVDKAASGSTVFIMVRSNVTLFQTQAKNENPWEDHSCSLCKGAGKIECPQKGCRKGAIMVKQRVLVSKSRGIGADVYADKSFPETCPTCDGNGGLPCRACGGRGDLK